MITKEQSNIVRAIHKYSEARIGLQAASFRLSVRETDRSTKRAYAEAVRKERVTFYDLRQAIVAPIYHK